MNGLVVSSLLPVVILIAVGWLAGRMRWIRGDSVKDLSNLVFLLLAPPLLFRSMSTVRIEQLSLKPVAAYFVAAGLIFAATLVWRGFNRTGVVLALANTYSNTVMIGIALVGLAYGPQGMVVLLTLISLHSLVLLTSATVFLELALAQEDAQRIEPGGAGRRPMARTVLRALRNAIVHPVQAPILLGLLFAQTGLEIPAAIDKPIALLGQAFSPVALMLVGITLALTPVGQHWRTALLHASIKNLVHPALVAAFGLAFGLRGLPLTVMVVAASLPIGANVFLFAQRYRTSEGLITASVVVSTVMALVSLSIVMALAGRL